MICSSILAPHSKKAPTPYEFFALPLMNIDREKSETSKQESNYAQMFNSGMLNPLKDSNIILYDKLKSKGLIDEVAVNKYIIDKWQGR